MSPLPSGTSVSLKGRTPLNTLLYARCRPPFQCTISTISCDSTVLDSAKWCIIASTNKCPRVVNSSNRSTHSRFIALMLDADALSLYFSLFKIVSLTYPKFRILWSCRNFRCRVIFASFIECCICSFFLAICIFKKFNFFVASVGDNRMARVPFPPAQLVGEIKCRLWLS